MKKYLLLALCIILSVFLFGQEIREMPVVNIKNIPFGSEKGQLGVGRSTFGLAGPYITAIGKEVIVISDLYNFRFNIYDLEVNFIKDIRYEQIEYYCGIMYKYKVFDSGNIVGVGSHPGPLVKISFVGKQIYIVPESKLPRTVAKEEEYWLYDEYVVFYDDQGLPGAVSPEGVLLEKGEIKDLLKEMKSTSVLRRQRELKDDIDNFLFKNNLIMIGDAILTKSFDTYLGFKRITNRKNINDSLRKIGDFKYGVVDGYDDSANVFCFIKKADKDLYVIFNKNGELLTMFLRNIKNAIFARNGDIYGHIFNAEKKQIEFYRIKNTWDPIAANSVLSKAKDTTTPKPAPLPQAVNIYASSFLTEPFDKNMYQPVKAFDGKPDTGWIEKVPGPGLGEYLGIELNKPITIDQITLMPGWFDARYWKQNNCVKRITIQLDDFETTVDLKDKMVPQQVRFKQPITFKRAKFTIRAVYPTSKWDDTALAEVEFYYKDQKIPLDISKFADQLKVVPEEE